MTGCSSRCAISPTSTQLRLPACVAARHLERGLAWLESWIACARSSKMTDQLNFEMRLDAAVKIYAANADGPVDAALIAATAVKASRRAGWWTRLSSIVQPRAADLPRQAMRLLLVATVAIVAIGSIGGFAIYWQR